MYDYAVRRDALKLLDTGHSVSETSARLGISRYTIREWRLLRDQGQSFDGLGPRECPRCSGTPTRPEPQDAYAYLLGLYLGDGCISKTRRDGVFVLRIACADAWPGLLEECKHAIRSIRPDNKVRAQQQQGCSQVQSHSKHWPCLFPQHGPGKKHLRKIELHRWQQAIVHQTTEAFVRGLIHSDGSRFTNRVRRLLPSGEHWYEYPRYLFVNESADVRNLFTEALDRLEIQWRYSKPNTVSVAKRGAVARLDEFVGPKY
jgi:hypothetical protein